MKERIAEAFVALVTEQRSMKVSVEALCRRAGVSKPTFYKYFWDKYAVTEHILRREVLDPMERLISVKLAAGIKDIRGASADFYRGFLRRKEFYCILIRDRRQNSLFDTIIRDLEEINRKHLEALPHMSPTDMAYISYRYAVLQAALLQKWMADGMEVSPEQLTDYYYFEYEHLDLNGFEKK